MTEPLEIARRMWTLVEPLHGVTYVTPQGRQAYEDAGLRGFWRGYFAGRAAPMGAVGPAVVTAVFFNFAPQMVNRAVPDVWSRADPEATLAARSAGSGKALQELLPADPAGTVATLERVVAALNFDGRVLSAANAALAPSTDPYARLWELATILREHRGDGHFAAWLAAGVTGLESIALRTGIDLDRATLQQARGWTDEEWEAAQARLVERGLLDPDGRATEAGWARFAAVEDATDRAAADCWHVLSAAELEELTGELAVLAASMPPAIANLLGAPQPPKPTGR
jgi:helix-turn-helix protein